MIVRRTLEGAPKWSLRDLRLDEARPGSGQHRSPTCAVQRREYSYHGLTSSWLWLW